VQLFMKLFFPEPDSGLRSLLAAWLRSASSVCGNELGRSVAPIAFVGTNRMFGRPTASRSRS
jgi:hypothetical protein